MVLRRIGVLSAAKIVGAVYAVFGVLGGLFFMALSLFGFSVAGANDEMPAFIGVIFGVGAIIVLPVMYACMGFVFGALSAALYNVFSGMVGGIELELQQGAAVR
jgi:hypothetical protein